MEATFPILENFLHGRNGFLSNAFAASVSKANRLGQCLQFLEKIKRLAVQVVVFLVFCRIFLEDAIHAHVVRIISELPDIP